MDGKTSSATLTAAAAAICVAYLTLFRQTLAWGSKKTEKKSKFRDPHKRRDSDGDGSKKSRTRASSILSNHTANFDGEEENQELQEENETTAIGILTKSKSSDDMKPDSIVSVTPPTTTETTDMTMTTRSNIETSEGEFDLSDTEEDLHSESMETMRRIDATNSSVELTSSSRRGSVIEIDDNEVDEMDEWLQEQGRKMLGHDEDLLKYPVQDDSELTEDDGMYHSLASGSFSFGADEPLKGSESDVHSELIFERAAHKALKQALEERNDEVNELRTLVTRLSAPMSPLSPVSNESPTQFDENPRNEEQWQLILKLQEDKERMLVAKHEAEIQALREEHEKDKKGKVANDDHIAQLCGDVENLRRERDNILAELTRLRNGAAESSSRIEKLLEEMEQKNRLIVDLRNQVQRLDRHLLSKTEECGNLRLRITEQEGAVQENERLQKYIKRISSERSFDRMRGTQQDPDVAVTFTWDYAGTSVKLVGNFDRQNPWKREIHMNKNPGGGFSVIQLLPRGTYHYKFVVDGTWMYDLNSPTAQDPEGHINNVLTVN